MAMRSRVLLHPVDDTHITVWAWGNHFVVPLEDAKLLVRFFLDNDYEVLSYWVDCVERVAGLLDQRIKQGMRT